MFERIERGLYWDKFWPLVDGCTPVDPACDHCWRARYAHRFDEVGAHHYLTTNNGQFNGEIELRSDRYDLPLNRKKPTAYFILNDLYHEKVPANFITRAYEVMEACPQHVFIVCTKRPERIDSVLYEEEGRFYMGGGDYLHNVWHLTTAGNQEMADKRIPDLLKLRQASPGWPVLGVSIEPMLGPIELDKKYFKRWNAQIPGKEMGFMLNDINWVVLGGESGPGARPMRREWATDVRDQCKSAGVPFFFKQWGEYLPAGQEQMSGVLERMDGWTRDYVIHCSEDEVFHVGKKAAGRLLDGREWNELPEVGRI